MPIESGAVAFQLMAIACVDDAMCDAQHWSPTNYHPSNGTPVLHNNRTCMHDSHRMRRHTYGGPKEDHTHDCHNDRSYLDEVCLEDHGTDLSTGAPHHRNDHRNTTLAHNNHRSHL